MKTRKLVTALSLAGVGLLSVSAAQAQNAVFDDRQPGSVLVYPLFDVNNNAGVAKSTTMKLSNIGNNDIWVHLIRVCGGIKSFGGEGLCQASDRVVKLTGRETFVRDVANFFGIDRANCPTGYIVAYVQATQFDKTPTRNNVLIGSTHINGSGPLNQRTAGMQAYGFQAVDGGGAIGMGGVFPRINFDGTNLTAPAFVYHTDFLATAGTRHSELTLLTLDIQAGAQNPPTLVALDWNNQKEEPFSGAIEYVCHVRTKLDEEVNQAQPGAGVQGGANFKAPQLGSAYGVLTMTPFTEGHAILGAITEVGQNRLTQRGLWHDNQARPTTFIGR